MAQRAAPCDYRRATIAERGPRRCGLSDLKRQPAPRQLPNARIGVVPCARPRWDPSLGIDTDLELPPVRMLRGARRRARAFPSVYPGDARVARMRGAAQSGGWCAPPGHLRAPRPDGRALRRDAFARAGRARFARGRALARVALRPATIEVGRPGLGQVRRRRRGRRRLEQPRRDLRTLHAGRRSSKPTASARSPRPAQGKRSRSSTPTTTRRSPPTCTPLTAPSACPTRP